MGSRGWGLGIGGMLTTVTPSPSFPFRLTSDFCLRLLPPLHHLSQKQFFLCIREGFLLNQGWKIPNHLGAAFDELGDPGLEPGLLVGGEGGLELLGSGVDEAELGGAIDLKLIELIGLGPSRFPVVRNYMGSQVLGGELAEAIQSGDRFLQTKRGRRGSRWRGDGCEGRRGLAGYGAR